jgi:hypothetical protein
MKAVKVLAIVLLAVFSYTAVQAQVPTHKHMKRHHHHMRPKHA